MIDPEVMGLIYLAVKALTTGRHEQNTRKVVHGIADIKRDLKAIKGHLGIEVAPDGRVIELRRAPAAGPDYEAAKP